MKTSELKRIVEENGYEFQKTKHFIFIRIDDFRVFGLDLDNNSVVLYDCVSLDTGGIKKIMVTLIEYSLTPLNEREDEKKYRIELAEIRESVLTKDGIRATIYTLSSMITSSNETKVILNNIFTQSEIDNFPKEIKRAIECGFLRKVEVE